MSHPTQNKSGKRASQAKNTFESMITIPVPYGPSDVRDDSIKPISTYNQSDSVLNTWKSKPVDAFYKYQTGRHDTIEEIYQWLLTQNKVMYELFGEFIYEYVEQDGLENVLQLIYQFHKQHHATIKSGKCPEHNFPEPPAELEELRDIDFWLKLRQCCELAQAEAAEHDIETSPVQEAERELAPDTVIENPSVVSKPRAGNPASQWDASHFMNIYDANRDKKTPRALTKADLLKYDQVGFFFTRGNLFDPSATIDEHRTICFGQLVSGSEETRKQFYEYCMERAGVDYLTEGALQVYEYVEARR